MNLDVVVAITLTLEEEQAWEDVGLRTAADYRAAVVRCATGTATLREVPYAPEVGAPTGSYHLRFTAEDIAQVDAARGEVPRATWVRVALNSIAKWSEDHSIYSQQVAAAEDLTATFGVFK